jgi:hypothetical protein
MKMLTLLVAVSLLVVAGCGDTDDSSSDEQTTTAASSAQSCIDRWNAETNGDYQTVLAGVISATGGDPEKFRAGTWPGSERTVSYRSAKDAFADTTGKAQVPSGACLIILPSTHAGEGTFFEDQGKWYLVWAPADVKTPDEFPRDAKRSIAEAETATADALGKLTLN